MLKGIASLLVLVLASVAGAETVYLTPQQALKRAFQGSAEVVSEKKGLAPEPKKRIEKALGGKIAKDQWIFYLGKSGAKIDGYALIDHEIGKTEPITFLTALDPKGVVQGVEILVYREPIGGEVKSENFRRQFVGKKETDPIRVGQDIKNITGATLSSRAVSLGVRRAALLWKEFYGAP